MGLQSRFMLYFVVIVVIAMSMIVSVVEQRMSSTLMEQTKMRGVAIANSIAATVKSDLLSYDYVSLQQAAEMAAEEEGLLYVIILNKEGVVAGFSGWPERQGQVLIDAVSVAVATSGGSLIQPLEASQQPGITVAHLDIAVPVHVEGTPVQWGTVRVGLSLAPMHTSLASTRLLLALLGLGTLMVVLVSARILSRKITQPLEGLAAATAHIAAGDLDHAVDEDLVGELGDLARSFNKMTNELKRSRDAIRYQNAHLEHMVQLRTSALEEKARELEKVNAELKELDRLKGDFLSNVSHELRTPLTSIRSFTEIMLDEEQELSGEERSEFLQIVASQAERLTRLISDLLDLSRIEAGEFRCQPEPMDVSQVADSVATTLRGLAADKGIQLRNEVHPGLPRVLADVDRLSQVLTNLAGNAVKFTSKGGTITFSARLSSRRRPVIGVLVPGQVPDGAFAGMESSEAEVGEYVVVSVRDTGPGIRASDEHRIFDKFGQVGNVLTDKPQGTGLGLAISGSIMVQHRGALWVESTPGVGSVFSFAVPVAGAEDPVIGAPAKQPGKGETSAAAAREAAVARPVPTAPAPRVPAAVTAHGPESLIEIVQRTAQGKLVLVVDDEPAIVTALTELLQPLGYRVFGCHTGWEAVSKAREFAPHAIILDIMMPGINGYDVLRLLKSEPVTAGIPVIVLSVLDEKEKAFALGAAEFVSKPFHKQHLLDNVRALA
jgi:signal transduction histidine kinase